MRFNNRNIWSPHYTEPGREKCQGGMVSKGGDTESGREVEGGVWQTYGRPMCQDSEATAGLVEKEQTLGNRD